MGERRPDGGRAHRRLPATTRERFWSYYRPRFGMLADKQPNPRAPRARRARGAGHARGRDHAEHRHAAPQGRLAAAWSRCTARSRPARAGTARPATRSSEVEPAVRRRGRRALRHAAAPVKPDVVLFGEMLPEQAMEEAHALCARRRPAAVRRHLARGLSGRRAARGDAPRAAASIAIVTKGPTPYDARGGGAARRRRGRRARGAAARAVRRGDAHRAERVVGASPQAVFAFLADLENHWLLADRFVEVLTLERPPDGGPARGGTVRMRGPLGLGRTARTRVVEAAPARRCPARRRSAAHRGARALDARARRAGNAGAAGGDGRACSGALEALLLAAGGRRWLERRFGVDPARRSRSACPRGAAQDSSA